MNINYNIFTAYLKIIMNRKNKHINNHIICAHKEGRSSYIANIIIHVILIYVLGRLTSWFSFLNDSFNIILWLLYLSCFATIVINIIYLFFDQDWFKSASKLFLNLFSSIIIYTIIVIFPFDIAQSNVIITNIILYIILFGTIIGAIVELIRFINFIFMVGRIEKNEK